MKVVDQGITQGVRPGTIARLEGVFVIKKHDVGPARNQNRMAQVAAPSPEIDQWCRRKVGRSHNRGVRPTLPSVAFFACSVVVRLGIEIDIQSPPRKRPDRNISHPPTSDGIGPLDLIDERQKPRVIIDHLEL